MASDKPTNGMNGRGPKTPVRLTPARREKFLAKLAAGYSVTSAALEVGIGRASLYPIRDRDDDFRKAWDAAVEEGTDIIEDELLRRGVRGVERAVWHQGQKVGTQLEFSDACLITMLKARRPEKFAVAITRGNVTVAGPEGGPVQIEGSLDGAAAALVARLAAFAPAA